jgi:hypothetical protein
MEFDLKCCTSLRSAQNLQRRPLQLTSDWVGNNISAKHKTFDKFHTLTAQQCITPDFNTIHERVYWTGSIYKKNSIYGLMQS